MMAWCTPLAVGWLTAPTCCPPPSLLPLIVEEQGVSLSGVPLWVGQPEANNVLRNWSPEEHKYQPARLKAAAKRLLLAAACNPRSASLERHPDLVVPQDSVV
ncbi:hypothetical protein ABBQ38_000585 [Trebouxia sp. C0009 RCD-2024]